MKQVLMEKECARMFAESQKMVISSTCFQHKIIHLGTWKLPGRRVCNQIDHVLFKEKVRQRISNVHKSEGKRNKKWGSEKTKVYRWERGV